MALKISKHQMATMAAICAMDEAIKNLKKQRVALVATLPAAPKKKTVGKGYFINPLTGKKEFYHAATKNRTCQD